MSTTFICDWGGVLMRTVDIRPRLVWEHQLDLTPGELAELLFRGAAWERAQRGQATVDDVWTELGRNLKLNEREIAALSRDFWAGDRLDPDLVALIRELRELGLRTALLSNHPSNLPGLLSDLGLDDLFDEVIVSALEERTKPDPAIYRLALDRLNATPSDAIFVDDQRINVEAARKLGMVAIHFRGARHLRRALATAGVPLETQPLNPVQGIRALIFDWGGVLYSLNFIKHTEVWEERLGLTPGALNRVLWGRKWKQLEIGAISQQEYDDYVAGRLGLGDREAVRQFYQEYYADDRLDQQMVAAVRSLRRSYRSAMLTNAFPNHAEESKLHHDFDPRAEFDVYVNSAEVGLAKPHPAVYRLVLDQLGVAPNEAIFMDDMVRNTDSAEALGIHTLVFTEAETGLADLAELLGHPITPEE